MSADSNYDYFCRDCGGKEKTQQVPGSNGKLEMRFQMVRRHMKTCEWQKELRKAGERVQYYRLDGRPCCVFDPKRATVPCEVHL